MEEMTGTLKFLFEQDFRNRDFDSLFPFLAIFTGEQSPLSVYQMYVDGAFPSQLKFFRLTLQLLVTPTLPLTLCSYVVSFFDGLDVHFPKTDIGATVSVLGDKSFKYPRVYNHVNVPKARKTARTTARDIAIFVAIVCRIDAKISLKDLVFNIMQMTGTRKKNKWVQDEALDNAVTF